ncbi:MAG TPA: lysylphosphatidylglycerol synthase domain-containing protein [Kofleriaceae bacterium]|nr:lysylphosphatidylglycerol synthase domain-containing protein [Kofleriaceae bacterium]
MNATVKQLGKLAIAVALVGFLIASDRLSLAPVRAILGEPVAWIAIVVLQLAILVLGAVRWWWIVHRMDAAAPRARELVRATWIGLFFGCVAPSVIATDVVRFRALREAGVSRETTVASLVLDRACGVLALCVLALVLAAPSVIELASPVRVAVIASVVAVVACAGFVLRRRRPVAAIAQALRTAVASPSTSIVAFGLGLVAHALKVVVMVIVVRAVGPATASVGDVIALSPPGLLVEALPLAPGGLGTAHLAFEHLYGSRAIAGGAALFNVYFVSRLAVNLLGGLAWLRTPAPQVSCNDGTRAASCR